MSAADAKNFGVVDQIIETRPGSGKKTADFNF